MVGPERLDNQWRERCVGVVEDKRYRGLEVVLLIVM